MFWCSWADTSLTSRVNYSGCAHKPSTGELWLSSIACSKCRARASKYRLTCNWTSSLAAFCGSLLVIQLDGIWLSCISGVFSYYFVWHAHCVNSWIACNAKVTSSTLCYIIILFNMCWFSWVELQIILLACLSSIAHFYPKAPILLILQVAKNNINFSVFFLLLLSRTRLHPHLLILPWRYLTMLCWVN